VRETETVRETWGGGRRGQLSRERKELQTLESTETCGRASLIIVEATRRTADMKVVGMLRAMRRRRETERDQPAVEWVNKMHTAETTIQILRSSTPRTTLQPRDDLLDRGVVSVELYLSRTVEDDIRTRETLESFFKPLVMLEEIFHAEDETAIGTQLELLHHSLPMIRGERERERERERWRSHLKGY
jgi:hypothetical protein